MHRNALHHLQITADAKTQVRHNVSRHAFCGNRTYSNQATQIVHQRFTPGTHRNVLCDPQIPPDAETQVQRNVSRGAFCGIHTGPT
jgi:hypothetical protein